MSFRFPLNASLFYLLVLLALPCRAEFVQVWSLGVQNGNPMEFGDETWEMNPPPGSATERDNDFYFAGSYPASVGAVAGTEPITNLERSVSSGNPLSRLHFNLSAAQATGTSRIRVVVHQVWGGWWNVALDEQGETYGTHVLEVRLNGTLLGTQSFLNSGTLVVEANAGAFTPVTGENVLEIRRKPDAPSSPDGWVQFDALGAVPMMVIRGENSDLLTAETVEAMAARRAAMETLVVPDQGHAPLLAETGTIARIIDFIAHV